MVVALLDGRGTAPTGAGAGAHHLGLTSRSQLSDIARRRAELNLARLLDEAHRVLLDVDDPVIVAYELHHLASAMVLTITRYDLHPEERAA